MFNCTGVLSTNSTVNGVCPFSFNLGRMNSLLLEQNNTSGDDHHNNSGRSEGRKPSLEAGSFRYENEEETLDLKNNSNNKDNFIGSSNWKANSDSQGS
jgi:hypothetical protein